MTHNENEIRSKVAEINLKIEELRNRRKALLSELGEGRLSWSAIITGGFGALMIGLGTGLWYQDVLPSWTGIVPAEFALVGMAGFLASTIRVPITSIVMVAEISGNHELLMPAMWVCGVAFWLNNGWRLYRSQVHDRESSPIHA